MSFDYCNVVISLALLVPVRARDNSPWRKTCALHNIKQMRRSSFGNDTGGRAWNSEFCQERGGAAAGAQSSNHSTGSKEVAKWSLSGPLVCLAIHLENRLETSGLQVTIQ